MFLLRSLELNLTLEDLKKVNLSFVYEMMQESLIDSIYSGNDEIEIINNYEDVTKGLDIFFS